LSKTPYLEREKQMSKYKLSQDHLQDLLEFYESNKRFPSYKSDNPQEKRLYSWVQSMKMAKRGKGTASYPDWLDKEAEEHGLSDLFMVLDKAKEQFKRLILFYQEHNRKPKRYNAISQEERKLAHWVYHMRQQRAKGDSSYPNWLDKEAEKNTILGWFLRHDIRQDKKGSKDESESKQEAGGDSD